MTKKELTAEQIISGKHRTSSRRGLLGVLVSTLILVLVLISAPFLNASASLGLGDTGCFAVKATNKDGGQEGLTHGPGCAPVADGGVVAPTPTPAPEPVTANARIVGDCGVLGIVSSGFLLSTDAPLPIGTEIAITGTRIADIGNFSITGGAGEVSSPSGTSRLVKLTQALPAGGIIELRSNLAMSKQFEINARVSIPSGVELGSAAKVDAKVTNTFFCTAS